VRFEHRDVEERLVASSCTLVAEEHVWTDHVERLGDEVRLDPA
jgi:hypothetical protein